MEFTTFYNITCCSLDLIMLFDIIINLRDRNYVPDRKRRFRSGYFDEKDAAVACRYFENGSGISGQIG